MKITITCFLAIILFFYCSAKNNGVKIAYSITTNFDTIETINRIDSLSKPDSSIDAYFQYYEKNELPDIYKVASAALFPYHIGNELTKAKIIFEGPSETLTREFYFYNKKIFYIKETYDVYDPEKWDANSKKTSSSVSQFYIYSDTSIKYIKDNKILLIEQKKRQEVLKEIVLVQSIVFKKQ